MSVSPQSFSSISRARSALVIIVAGMIVVITAAPSSAIPGAERWAKRYDGPASGTDYGIDDAVSPDGTAVFITGSALGNTANADMTTIAYNTADGTKKWKRRYNGPADGWDVGIAIGVSPDGSTVFVTGGSDGLSRDRDYVTVAYAASDGTRLWARRYQGPTGTFDQTTGLQVAPNGQAVFVTGMSYTSFFNEYVTIAYAATDGTELWTKATNGYSQENALALSPDGSRAFVTGVVANSSGDFDYTTVALDASTGLKLWGERYNGRADGGDLAVAVGVSPTGSKVYVTGRSEGATSLLDYATVAYRASDGSQLWVRRYDGPGHGYDGPAALAVTPDGSRIVVTGSSPGVTTTAYATVAYDPTGAQVWVKRYEGPSHGVSAAYDVAVSGDSAKVIVTGSSASGSSTVPDYATVAYEAVSGTKLWASRYDGPDGLGDYAQGISISQDGSAAFVIGYSVSTASAEDYATVAYSLA